MRRICVVALAAIALVSIGCGGPPKPKYANVYRGLSENLPRLDSSTLRGRRILIDPGHGGHFRGTLGQEGLEEARVNLGVSLYLWGLLREAGAEVFLTRSAEKDFLTPGDSTLAGELGVRVGLVDSLQPDMLVSIHHNAQNDRDPGKNAVETYYSFGDRASRDLAFAVHRHLMRNLGIDDGEVRPGNYFILRNIDIPAILGEGSYLTHPPVEDNLRLSEKQQLEAEAYFLGILEYFSRGTPVIDVVAPLDTVLASIPTMRFRVRDIGGLGIDPAGVEVTVNERLVDAHLDESGQMLSYPLPWDSPNGDYRVTAAARNVLGNSSQIRRISFDLDLPPETVAFLSDPEGLPAQGSTLRVRARLLDRRGLSIADGTPVTIGVSSGRAPTMAVVHEGVVEFPVTIEDDTAPLRVSLAARGREFEHVVAKSATAVRQLKKLIIADELSREPITNALVVFADSLLANGSSNATYFLPETNMGSDGVWADAQGYMPSALDDRRFGGSANDTLFLTPWFEGRLIGRRFILDPEGGFGWDPGMGRLGLSGPHVNLQVATYLAEYLEAAGAAVELTRRTEQTLSPRDVVDVTNRFAAHRYIEIRHRSAHEDSGLAVNAFHFPGSRAGSDMAARVQEALAQALGLELRAPRELVTFPLQQTACPAIVVEFPSIASMDEELRLGEPWYLREQAYGLFVGILRHYQVSELQQWRVVVDADSLPGNWLATIDGNWNFLTSPAGSARFVAPASKSPSFIHFRRGDRRFTHRIESAQFDPTGAERVLRIGIPPKQ